MQRERFCSVGVILRKNWECGYTDFQGSAGSVVLDYAGLYFLNNIGQLIAKENGHDCRRCLVGSKSVVISGCGNREAQQIRIIINSLMTATRK